MTTLTPEIVPALCGLARRYLTLSGEEFADAVVAGDPERADAAIGEAVKLSAALKRQEAAL